jgi:hypothetical protein
MAPRLIAAIDRPSSQVVDAGDPQGSAEIDGDLARTP